MSSTTVATKALPAVIARQGGAVVQVMNDLESYLPEGYGLTGVQSVAIARFVEQEPALNTEECVATMAYVSAYHGVHVRKDFKAAIADYGLDRVVMATELMYELGMRTTGAARHVYGRGSEQNRRRIGVSIHDVAYGDNHMSWTGRYGLHAICELIAAFDELGLHITSADNLAELVYQYGGLREVLGLSVEDLDRLIRDASHDDVEYDL